MFLYYEKEKYQNVSFGRKKIFIAMNDRDIQRDNPLRKLCFTQAIYEFIFFCGIILPLTVPLIYPHYMHFSYIYVRLYILLVNSNLSIQYVLQFHQLNVHAAMENCVISLIETNALPVKLSFVIGYYIVSVVSMKM